MEYLLKIFSYIHTIPITVYAALSFDHVTIPFSQPYTHARARFRSFSPSPVASIPRNAVNFLNLSKTYTLAIAHELAFRI